MGVLVSFADFSADAAGHPREGDAWAEHQHCGGTVVVEAVMLGEVALLCDGCGCFFAARRPRRQAGAARRPHIPSGVALRGPAPTTAGVSGTQTAHPVRRR